MKSPLPSSRSAPASEDGHGIVMRGQTQSDPRVQIAFTAGWFRAHRARRQTLGLSTPLDGLMTVSLRSGRGLDGDLYVYDNHGRRLARSASSSGRERVRFDVCGEPRVRVQVVAYRGSG